MYTLAIESKLNQTTWDARVFTGLSNILSDRGEYEEALKMGNKGLDLLRGEDNRIGVSRALNDLGSIYHRLKEYDKALEYIFEALKILKANNVKHFVLGSLIDIANIYLEIDQPANALLNFIWKPNP
ncbi:MAG: tetratricopeptide repeat protein [Crocinitomicaceae bacterium]|nr:tetratricopeptide repeat protein [Crocinitomicaceae bacterium]